MTGPEKPLFERLAARAQTAENTAQAEQLRQQQQEMRNRHNVELNVQAVERIRATAKELASLLLAHNVEPNLPFQVGTLKDTKRVLQKPGGLLSAGTYVDVPVTTPVIEAHWLVDTWFDFSRSTPAYTDHNPGRYRSNSRAAVDHISGIIMNRTGDLWVAESQKAFEGTINDEGMKATLTDSETTLALAFARKRPAEENELLIWEPYRWTPVPDQPKSEGYMMERLEDLGTRLLYPDTEN